MTYVHLKRFGGLYLLLVTYVSDYMFLPTRTNPGREKKWNHHEAPKQCSSQRYPSKRLAHRLHLGVFGACWQQPLAGPGG